eukprot:scaffold311839_cov33-Tisochrysis_lutea.AAC.3
MGSACDRVVQARATGMSDILGKRSMGLGEPPESRQIVEPSGLTDHVGARVNKQVICIAEHQLSPSLATLPFVNRLQRTVCANRHEGRRVNDAMRRVDSPDASTRARLVRAVYDFETKEVSRLPGWEAARGRGQGH